MFPTGFKPLLACNDQPDVTKLTYPLMASPKLDGWRCHVSDWNPGQPRLMSRTLKAIPNRHVQVKFAMLRPFVDGELLTYTDGKIDPLNVVQSKLSTAEGEHDVRFHAFDTFVDPVLPYEMRLRTLNSIVRSSGGLMEYVPVERINNPDELTKYEAHCVDVLGHEGIMTRAISGRYKFGRSTMKEEILVKVKRFTDDEGTIVAMRERMTNENEAEKDAFGRTKRSSHAAGKSGLGTMGSFDIEWNGVTFNCGGGRGLTDRTRAEFWAMRDAIVGRQATFKFKGVGPNGKPLLPTFLSLRNDL